MLERLAATVAPPRSTGKAHGLIRRPEQGARLDDAFVLLFRRYAIRDDARTRLDVHASILHERGAQDDARVHIAVRREVADATCIGTAALLLQLIDDFHR